MNDCHLEISTELGLQVNSISPISYLSPIPLLLHFYLPLASFVFPSRLTLHSSHFLDFCALIWQFGLFCSCFAGKIF